MKTTNTAADCLNWKIEENWGVSRDQDLMLVDRMSLEIITHNVANLSAAKIKARIEILMKVKLRLIEDWDSGHKET